MSDLQLRWGYSKGSGQGVRTTSDTGVSARVSPAEGWPVAPDPDDIRTRVDLSAALNQLRRSRSYAALSRAAEALRVRDGRATPLPTSTLSDWFRGKRTPEADGLMTYLRICGIAEAEFTGWLAARDRVAGGTSPASKQLRVAESKPRLLGVHAAIRLDRQEDSLPRYVRRDTDSRLEEALAAAADGGGNRFVLLLGDSSVGKTRSLYEAVRKTLPTWWLAHPENAGQVMELAWRGPERTVVWLDDLTSFLGGPERLTAAPIDRLMSGGNVVVGTIWSSEYRRRIALPLAGSADLYHADRKVLRLADVVTLGADLTHDERRRAEAFAADDERVRVALDATEFGFAQVLGAARELAHWWEQAPDEDCHGKALITAAIDARRVGISTPVTEECLREAAHGYLLPRQQARAPRDWFAQGMAYATTQLLGATSALVPTATQMADTIGYNAADFLQQYGMRRLRTEPIPQAAWRAIVAHHHPNDIYRLATSARRRGAVDIAIELLEARLAAGPDRGDPRRPGRYRRLPGLGDDRLHPHGSGGRTGQRGRQQRDRRRGCRTFR
jgi:hypothetical protein